MSDEISKSNETESFDKEFMEYEAKQRDYFWIFGWCAALGFLIDFLLSLKDNMIFFYVFFFCLGFILFELFLLSAITKTKHFRNLIQYSFIMKKKHKLNIFGEQSSIPSEIEKHADALEKDDLITHIKRIHFRKWRLSLSMKFSSLLKIYSNQFYLSFGFIALGFIIMGILTPMSVIYVRWITIVFSVDLGLALILPQISFLIFVRKFLKMSRKNIVGIFFLSVLLYSYLFLLILNAIGWNTIENFLSSFFI